MPLLFAVAPTMPPRLQEDLRELAKPALDEVPVTLVGDVTVGGTGEENNER